MEEFFIHRQNMEIILINVKIVMKIFMIFEVTDTEGLEDTHNVFCACRMYGSRISDRRSMLYNSNSRVQGIRKC